MAVYRHILFLPPPLKSLPPKNEKPPTAEKLPLYFGFTAPAEVVTAKKRKTAYRQNITAVWHYCPKSTAMSERSEGMAPRLLVGISDNWGSNLRGDFLVFGISHFFCSLFLWFFGSF